MLSLLFADDSKRLLELNLTLMNKFDGSILGGLETDFGATGCRVHENRPRRKLHQASCFGPKRRQLLEARLDRWIRQPQGTEPSRRAVR
jgi:hypothetical protein